MSKTFDEVFSALKKSVHTFLDEPAIQAIAVIFVGAFATIIGIATIPAEESHGGRLEKKEFIGYVQTVPIYELTIDGKKYIYATHGGFIDAKVVK